MFDTLWLETEMTRRDSKMDTLETPKSPLVSAFEIPSHGWFMNFAAIFRLRF